MRSSPVRRRFLFVLLTIAALFVLPVVLPAQDHSPAVVGPEDPPEGPFRVVSIRYDVVGMSRPGPLMLVSNLREGETASDADALNELLWRARQNLLNRRVFDGISVRWEIVPSPDAQASGRVGASETESTGAESTDAFVPVDVTFHIDDGWTLLPIPFYRYNSNSGHNPFVVVYWDNILGSLTDFGLSAGYYSRNWLTPFRWDVRVDWREIRLWNREWNLSFDQVFETMEQATPTGDVEFAYSGYSTRVGLSTSFSLTDWLRYSLSPRVGVEYGYDTIVASPEESLPQERATVGVSHGLSTGRVDWIGNLRRGWSAGVSNGIAFDPERRHISSDISLRYGRHWLPWPRVSPAIRAGANHDLNGDRLSRGGVIRGVPDNRVFGQTLLTVNSQVSVVLFDWRRVADVQLVPFVDGAVALKQSRSVSWDDLFVGVGTDLIVFPDFVRGFEVRLSVGIDARDLLFGGDGVPTVEFFVTESLQF